MTTEALKFIKESMEQLELPYEFLVWTSDLVFPYIVGEYTEVESFEGDDLQEETNFLLTATTNTCFMDLEEIKETIKNFFPEYGMTAILDNGSGIVVSFTTAFPVQSGEQGLYRMQINLKIKEWKGC